MFALKSALVYLNCAAQYNLQHSQQEPAQYTILHTRALTTRAYDIISIGPFLSLVGGVVTV